MNIIADQNLKMIKEINHIIMEVQIKEVDLEILKNLKELSSLNELISEIEVNSIKESKENNVIKGPKTVDNINYVYYRSLYSKTLTFTINIMKTKSLQKLDFSLDVLSVKEMEKINGGSADGPKSIFYYAGYVVGKFIGLASWAGVGLS